MSRRLLLLLASCVVLASSACADATAPETRRSSAAKDSARATPSPSTSGAFDVGGHKLYAECVGSGSPTVVLLHGLGSTSLDWSQTVPLLEETRTCSYDRRNVGRSDYVEGMSTALDAVEDLKVLLPQLRAEPPYLLVGHSYGGLLALMYAGSYPADVSGVVLADASMPFLTTLDLPLTETELRDRMNSNQENLEAYDGFAAARKLEPSLPDVPMVYIYALKQDLPPGWPVAAYERRLRAWLDALPQGSLVECTCSHDVPAEDPEGIAAEVQKVMSGTGGRGTP